MSDFLDIAWFSVRLHLVGMWRAYAVIICAVIVIAGGFWHFFMAPPPHAADGIILVRSGEPLSTVANDLRADGVIRSPYMLKLLLYASGNERHIKAGDYEFSARESVLTVARRIATGDTGISEIRVTLTEGMASFDMARTLAADIPGFDAAAFQTLAAEHEGYLFPDTYFFLPTVTPQQVVDEMTANFNTRIASDTPLISASGHSLADIITMASIVEKEAKTPEDQKLVAGILWNRIASGIRLDVDAPFGYIHQQDGYQATGADTQSASPYNTYRNDGLPPGPISNPGIGAIEAAADPTPSDYLYYLTDSSGVMHYSKTFAEHERNIQMYL